MSRPRARDMTCTKGQAEWMVSLCLSRCQVGPQSTMTGGGERDDALGTYKGTIKSAMEPFEIYKLSEVTMHPKDLASSCATTSYRTLELWKILFVIWMGRGGMGR